MFFEEMVDEHRNVGSSPPKRRQIDGDDRKAIVEILPELAFLHPCRKIVVSCGHDPDVDRDRAMGADPFYGTFLQHPQQLDLDFEW